MDTMQSLVAGSIDCLVGCLVAAVVSASAPMQHVQSASSGALVALQTVLSIANVDSGLQSSLAVVLGLSSTGAVAAVCTAVGDVEAGDRSGLIRHSLVEVGGLLSVPLLGSGVLSTVVRAVVMLLRIVSNLSIGGVSLSTARLLSSVADVAAVAHY